MQVGKGYANRAANAANKRAAAAVADEGSAALAAVFGKGAKAVDDLKKVGRKDAHHASSHFHLVSMSMQSHCQQVALECISR